MPTLLGRPCPPSEHPCCQLAAGARRQLAAGTGTRHVAHARKECLSSVTLSHGVQIYENSLRGEKLACEAGARQQQKQIHAPLRVQVLYSYRDVGFVGCHDTWFRYQCIIDFKSLNLIGFYMCTLLLT